MNEMLVEVADVPGAAVGDKVTLIGRDGKEEITVEEMANAAQTIPYEIMTGIGAAVERKYKL